MKRGYWIFVTNEKNWITIKEREIYGFNEKSKKDLDKLNIGDLIIFYIIGKHIGGAFEITSLKEETNIKFKGQDYPYKIKLKKIIVPKESIDFTDKMVSQISIFKNAMRWGTILMGRATKEITKQDYEYFEGILNAGNK
jgi:predicted RNA-binding protein